MKTSITRSVSAIALLAVSAVAASLNAAGPVYSPSAETHLIGQITSVRDMPSGPTAGIHLTVQTKTNTADVYLGPAAFLKIFKTNFVVGAPVQIIGARIAGAGETILAREITEGATTITLRESTGEPVWDHWGVVASGITG